MSRFVDLTHNFEDGMPGFRLRDPSGQMTQFSATVRPFLTHEQSKPNYEGKASFEITEVSFHTSIGTYIDSPRHRYEDMGDIASLQLENLILPGVVLDARHCTPTRPLTVDDLPHADTLAGRAVLVHFGWDRHWGRESYYDFPYADRSALKYLLDARIALFGVDSINADSTKDLERPAHTWFLKNKIQIVENLTGLDKLLGHRFRFFAIPLKVRNAAAFPIRAFAEIG